VELHSKQGLVWWVQLVQGRGSCTTGCSSYATGAEGTTAQRMRVCSTWGATYLTAEVCVSCSAAGGWRFPHVWCGLLLLLCACRSAPSSRAHSVDGSPQFCLRSGLSRCAGLSAGVLQQQHINTSYYYGGTQKPPLGCVSPLSCMDAKSNVSAAGCIVGY
jgi:hypothetical protein